MGCTKVKTHKRKGKNKVSVVKEHTRVDKRGKKMKKGAGEEYTKKQVDSCDTSKCSTSDLEKGAEGKWGKHFAKKAKKELARRNDE